MILQINIDTNAPEEQIGRTDGPCGGHDPQAQ